MPDPRSYRCSHCDLCWPTITEARDCPSCGRLTWPCDMKPDKTYAEARATKSSTPYSDQLPEAESPVAASSATPAHAHRVERFLDMGFGEANAQLLAAVQDVKGFYLYHGDVRRALENGATHEQMVQIHA